jgi:hypothetical protein
MTDGEILATLVLGALIGLFFGWQLKSTDIERGCEKGTQWQTMTHTYRCTAEKRP